MDNLQYNIPVDFKEEIMNSFKPCYKWIIFNM